MGAKKGGFGAQKVKKDFAEIEREAELADQVSLIHLEQLADMVALTSLADLRTKRDIHLHLSLKPQWWRQLS